MVETGGERGDLRVVGDRLGDRAAQSLQEGLQHYRSCPEYEQLNDLLHKGKSATMLPSIAASSSGHWNQEASRRWHRATEPSSDRRTCANTSPRKASTSADPSRWPPDGGRAARTGPGGMRASIVSMRSRLSKTSSIRTQMRALTSPSGRVGTLNLRVSYGG